MINKKNIAVFPAFLTVMILISIFCGTVVFAGNSYGVNIPKGPFYILKVKKRFKNALFDLKQGIEDANFSILAGRPPARWESRPEPSGVAGPAPQRRCPPSR